MVLDLYVLKRNGCIFDLSFAAPPDALRARRRRLPALRRRLRRRARGAVVDAAALDDDGVVRAAGWVGHQLDDACWRSLGRADAAGRARAARASAAARCGSRDIAYQMLQVGVRSLPLALTMAAFAGMVLAFQFGYGLERFGAKLYIGQTTVTALLRELGPILTALVVGGRIGAGIAAELGGMAVTEQIDAVRALGADPVQRLVAPRLLAVTHRAAAPGGRAPTWSASSAGMLVGRLQYGVSPRLFVRGVVRLRHHRRFRARAWSSRWCSAFIIGAIACYEGMRAERRHRGRRPRHHARGGGGARWPCSAADFLLTKLMLSAVMRDRRRRAATGVREGVRRQASSIDGSTSRCAAARP